MTTEFVAIGQTGRGEGEQAEFSAFGDTAEEARTNAAAGTGNPPSHFRVLAVTAEQAEQIRRGATPYDMAL